MKLLRKWNDVKHQYVPYFIPDEWNTPLYTEDMDEIVNCAECGRKILYGMSYTSRLIHDHIGLGYPVCEECHRKEFIQEEF